MIIDIVIRLLYLNNYQNYINQEYFSYCLQKKLINILLQVAYDYFFLFASNNYSTILTNIFSGFIKSILFFFSTLNDNIFSFKNLNNKNRKYFFFCFIYFEAVFLIISLN